MARTTRNTRKPAVKKAPKPSMKPSTKKKVAPVRASRRNTVQRTYAESSSGSDTDALSVDSTPPRKQATKNKKVQFKQVARAPLEPAVHVPRGPLKTEEGEIVHGHGNGWLVRGLF